MKEIEVSPPQVISEPIVAAPKGLRESIVNHFTPPEVTKDVFPKEDIAKKENILIVHSNGYGEMADTFEKTPGTILPGDTLILETTENESGEQPASDEHDFKTPEAKKAYEAYMEAIRLFDLRTGDGVERLMKAIDDVEVHAKDMSLSKLFSIMIVSVPLLMGIWIGDTIEDQAKEKGQSNRRREGEVLSDAEGNEAREEKEQKPQISSEIFRLSKLEKLPIAT